jgi:hypothetical protein
MNLGFSGNMEFLSSNGWVKFKDYNGERVAQYISFTNDIEFVEPFKFTVFNQHRFIRIASDNFEQVLTTHQQIPFVGYGVVFTNPIEMINSYNDHWELITGNVGGFRFNTEYVELSIEEAEDSTAYLFSTPSGLMIVRNNGKISVATAQVIV